MASSSGTRDEFAIPEIALPLRRRAIPVIASISGTRQEIAPPEIATPRPARAMASSPGTPLERVKQWAKSIEQEFALPENHEAGNGESSGRERFHIFRVPDSWKKLHNDVFDPDFLSLGLFSELDSTNISKPPTQFKIAVVKRLIEHVKNTEQKKQLSWKALRDRVVKRPIDMQDYYDLEKTQLTDEAVRNVLALDSVFLCGYLDAYLLQRSHAHTESLCANIVGQRSPSFHQKLLNDIVKIENQIPLVLIQRVMKIITGRRSSTINVSESDQKIEQNMDVSNSDATDQTIQENVDVENSDAVDQEIQKNVNGRNPDAADPEIEDHEHFLMDEGIHGGLDVDNPGWDDVRDAWVQLHSKSLPGFGRRDPEMKWKGWNFKDCKHLLGCLCCVMERKGPKEGSDWRGGLSSSRRFDRPAPKRASWFRRMLSFISDLFDDLFWGLLLCFTQGDYTYFFRIVSRIRRRLQEALGFRRQSHREVAHPILDPMSKLEEISLPPASKLRERGIHFQAMTDDTGDIVPVFERGRVQNLSATLYIPSFSILQNTELIWRNMLAYILDCSASNYESEFQLLLADRYEEIRRNVDGTKELLALLHELDHIESVYNRERRDNLFANVNAYSTKQGAADFVSFMMFMDEMIDTEQDVALLRDGKNRVIKQNLLGSNKEVANLFNTIAREQTIASTDYGDKWKVLRRDIDVFVSQQPRIMLLEFFRYFFGQAWLFPSVAAAILLLSLAFLQTVYTILGYY